MRSPQPRDIVNRTFRTNTAGDTGPHTSARRVCRGRRSTGCQRGAVAFSRRERGGSTEQPLSSRAISVNGFSSSPSRGSRLGWIFAGGRAPCTSITAPRIRSECRPISCWGRNYRMLTAMRRSGVARFRRSTARHLPFGGSIGRKRKSARLPRGADRTQQRGRDAP